MCIFFKLTSKYAFLYSITNIVHKKVECQLTTYIEESFNISFILLESLSDGIFK